MLAKLGRSVRLLAVAVGPWADPAVGAAVIADGLALFVFLAWLAVRHDGTDRRLTDVHGHVVEGVLS